LKCDNSCLTCKENKDACLSCNSNLSLISGICKCKENEFLNIVLLKCETCDKSCS